MATDPVTTVLATCLGIEAGEGVLVISDRPKRALAEQLVSGARHMGADASWVEIVERSSHGEEPPAAVAAAMRAASVVVAPTSKSLSHTAARKQASEAGARVATMPDISWDVLERTMSADYSLVRQRSRAVAEVLSRGETVRITTDLGTDVTFDISGREGLADDGDLRHPGAFGNLPAGEGFIAPLEGRTQGRILFDGSIWPLGALEEPVVVTIEDGVAVAVEGPRAEEFRAVLEPHGEAAFAVAELGIGTNERATLSGVVLEDEKILGTIHVALGDNHSFGGTNRVASHQDGVVLSPRVEVDGEVIAEGGRLRL